MPSDEAVLARLDALIERCAGITGNDWPALNALDAQAAEAVAAIAGRDTDYYRLVHEGPAARSQSAPSGALHLRAAMSALRDDVANGYLRRQADLVAADVFGDFLDMAEYLLDNGYFHPAASLIGAVLEDGLRRLARGADLGVKSKDDLGSLNGRLAERKVYSNLERSGSAFGRTSATTRTTGSSTRSAKRMSGECTRASPSSWPTTWARQGRGRDDIEVTGSCQGAERVRTSWRADAGHPG